MIHELKESEYQRVRPVFEGLRYNLVIDWEDNRPSIAVAEKVGFEKAMDYAVFRFEL